MLPFWSQILTSFLIYLKVPSSPRKTPAGKQETHANVKISRHSECPFLRLQKLSPVNCWWDYSRLKGPRVVHSSTLWGRGGLGSPKKPHGAAAPPTLWDRAAQRSSLPAVRILRGAPTWIPIGQVPVVSARAVTVSVGLESGCWAPSFNSPPEGFLGRGRRGPGELGLLAGHRQGQAG